MAGKPDFVSSILADYDSRMGLFKDFASSTESLVKTLLETETHPFHSVASRVKDRDHLEEKCKRPGKNYTSISEVTDVIGVRVIAYFEDEVDRIGALIEREFEVDRENSIDKRKVLDPDRFGYLSLHYVCALSTVRGQLPENKRFKDLKCEIQIRSVLQHAWAEIEHDLGYKAGSVIPAPIRRRFSQLAGLLELADQEFLRIRDDLAEYTSHVKSALPSATSQIEIDEVSIAAFISSDEVSIRVDKAIAAIVHGSLTPAPPWSPLAAMCRFVGLKTIGELEELLRKYESVIVKQAIARLQGSNYEQFVVGVGVFYLLQIIAASRSEDVLINMYVECGIASPNESSAEAAKEDYGIIKSLLESEG